MKRLGQLERHEQLRFADSPSARENRRSSNMNLGFGKSGTRSSTAEVIESDPPSEKNHLLLEARYCRKGFYVLQAFYRVSLMMIPLRPAPSVSWSKQRHGHARLSERSLLWCKTFL